MFDGEKIKGRRLGEATDLSVGPSSCFGDNAVHFSFRVENYMHLRKAYGLSAADAAVAMVEVALRRSLGEGCRVVRGGRGEVSVRFRRAVHLLFETPAGVNNWLRQFCMDVALTAFDTGAGFAHPWLSAAWGYEEGGPWVRPEPVANSFAFVGDALGDGEGWAAQYRSDMALVARLLPSMRFAEGVPEFGEDMTLSWQSVCGGDDGCALYYPAREWFYCSDGVVHASSSVRLSFERLGFMPLVDCLAVSRVVAELEADPDPVVGVCVSARTASSDYWWGRFAELLRLSPTVASRLIIEIAETSNLLSVSSATNFVSAMRTMGCGIALAGFGTGFGSIRQLMIFSPDIVKVDRFFLKRALQSDQDRIFYTHLVKLAASTGAQVVAEGVDSEVEADLARCSGVHWQQGGMWGRPSVSRPWKSGYSGFAAQLNKACDLERAYVGRAR